MFYKIIAIDGKPQGVIKVNVIAIIHHVYLSYSTDIDECLLGRAACHQNAECVNVPGSFMCVCNSGYTGDGVDCRGKTHEQTVCACNGHLHT